ncbi:MAG: alpha/beta hydrolase, partial [Hyphomonadaceae bacterium]
MKRWAIMSAALVLSACNGEKAVAPTPAAPAAPVYKETWLSGGDAAPTLQLHETQYGLHGRIIDPLGKAYPLRSISQTETGLTFAVPALDAVLTATKTPEGAWAGKWEQIGHPAEDVSLASLPGAPEAQPAPDGSNPRFVTLTDGRQMFIHCIGSGAPAVLFDSGAGSDSTAWHGVWQEVGKTTLSCTYDRAGLGLSDPGPFPRDTAAVANDIEAMLTAAAIPGPYILVGHSLGSYHTREFANTRFDKMAGLVLIDPSGDGQDARFKAAMPEAFATLEAEENKVKSLNCVANLREKLHSQADQLSKDCFSNDADMIESTLSETDAMAVASTEELTK